MSQKITTCLWFDREAEDAARFYTSVFRDSKITAIVPYPEKVHAQEAGSVMIVAFELNGRSFTALNGGPFFTHSEAISLVIECATQAEIDDYWEKLSAVPESEQCGWVKDKFGISWQVVPNKFPEWLGHPDPAKSGRVFSAMMQMKKIDIATLQCAFDGE